MGLFGQLRDTLQNVWGAGKSPAKRYYEVVLLLLSHVEYLTKDDIKTYFQVKYNEECDDNALDKALSKFSAVNPSRQNRRWYGLSLAQLNNEKVQTSYIQEEEILNICYSKFIQQTRTKFKEILEIVKKDPSFKLLEQGMSKYLESFPRECSPERKLVAKTFGEEIAQHLLVGDPTIQTILTDKVWDILCYRNDKGNGELVVSAYAIAMRGIRFEKLSETPDAYTPITDEECKEAVLASAYYQEKIKQAVAERPFDLTTENCANGYAREIMKAWFVYGSYPKQWETWATKDARFSDALCYYAWKSIAEQYADGDQTEIDSIAEMITDAVSGM